MVELRLKREGYGEGFNKSGEVVGGLWALVEKRMGGWIGRSDGEGLKGRVGW